MTSKRKNAQFGGLTPERMQELVAQDNADWAAMEKMREYEGTEGQDRDNYSDTQDRDSYTVEDET